MTLRVPSSALEALKAHRHLRGPYVFCQADGQPHTNGTMNGPLERALREVDICREQGRIGWHDLRHTYGNTEGTCGKEGSVEAAGIEAV